MNSFSKFNVRIQFTMLVILIRSMWIIHMRYSYSDRVAQVVERDASNIMVVSSILTTVEVFFSLSRLRLIHLRALFHNITGSILKINPLLITHFRVISKKTWKFQPNFRPGILKLLKTLCRGFMDAWYIIIYIVVAILYIPIEYKYLKMDKCAISFIPLLFWQSLLDSRPCSEKIARFWLWSRDLSKMHQVSFSNAQEIPLSFRMVYRNLGWVVSFKHVNTCKLTRVNFGIGHPWEIFLLFAAERQVLSLQIFVSSVHTTSQMAKNTLPQWYIYITPHEMSLITLDKNARLKALWYFKMGQNFPKW